MLRAAFAARLSRLPLPTPDPIQPLSSPIGFRSALASALVGAFLLGLVAPVWGHLALIRQGQESEEFPEPDDRFGRALISGDFNGDNFDDLAMGAPDESNQISEIPVQGAVVVSYGSEFGLQHTGADLLTIGAVTDNVVRYGRALASGDFNKDGFDDLAVGAPELDDFSIVDVGVVWIHMGSAQGLSSVPSLILDQEDAGGVNEADDMFGWSVHTDDFNNDTYDDLVVGAIGEDNEAGAVFWFFGSQNGLTTAGAGFAKQSTLGGTNDGGEWFGHDLESGDFDDNGWVDLAIGTPKKNVGLSGQFGDGGMVWVILNTAAGLGPAFVTNYTAGSLGWDDEAGSWFGWSLAAGVFWDDDAVPDLAIGQPNYDQNGVAQSGRVIVLEFISPPVKMDLVSKTIIPFPPNDTNVLRQGVNGVDDVQIGDNFGFHLAAGDFDNDNLDDIGVGVPGESVTVPELGAFANAGMAHVFYGQPQGPGWWAVDDFNSHTQNDIIAQFDAMGQAVAFGAFDGSGRDNLAVGAPGKDYLNFTNTGSTVFEAGCVYVVAPWRQPDERPHRSSLVYDCQGDIVYSQRMFDHLRPASTTKAMTLLLTCDAIATQTVDRNDPYTVPNWVAVNVGGSQMDLIGGETLSIDALMKGLITVSGNDAAYALADATTGGGNPWNGGYSGTTPAFVNIMNTKAGQLGMTRTTLTNPPGLDVANHYTTAIDFADLSVAGMQNACFREIVGEPMWEIDRDIPDYLQGWLGIVPIKTKFNNGYLMGIQSRIPGAIGIKGGNTPGASKTGLWAATGLGGEVIATAFGVRDDDEPNEGDKADCLSCTGEELLKVGLASCEPGLVLPPPPPDDPGIAYGTYMGIPTMQGTGRSLVGQIDECDANIQVEVWRTTHNKPQVDLRLALARTTSATIGRGGTLNLLPPNGTTTPLGDAGVRLTNVGETLAELEITLDTTPPVQVTLAPFETWEHDTGPSKSSRKHENIVINNIGDTSIIDLEERGYLYSAVLNSGAGSNVWTASLQCGNLVPGKSLGGGIDEQTLTLYVSGQDLDNLDEVAATMHQSGGSTGLDLPDGPGRYIPNGYRLDRPVPNPFNPTTTIRFLLPSAGLVSVEVYDLRGRLVRTLVGGYRPAGEHDVQWNGKDQSGATVASGVYLVKMKSGEFAASERVVLLK